MQRMENALCVRSLSFSKSDIKKFILFAWEIYKNDPLWVPPLIMDQLKLLHPKKNPFFLHSSMELLGAYEQGKMVGRIAIGINNNSNQFRKENVAFFGFFECVNRQEVANALFNTATQWANQRNIKKICGPFNPTFYNEMGILVEGFDTPPYILMIHNPKYYENLLINFGFSKAIDAYAYYIEDSRKLLTESLLQMSAHVEKTYHPTIRPIDKGKHFMRDAYTVMDMVNESLANNWGFCPLNKQELEFTAKDLKAAVVPDLCFIVEVNGKPAGVGITFPNYNEAIKHANGRLFPFGLLKILYYSRNIKTARTWQLGVTQEFQRTGLGTYCYVEITKRALKRGISEGEMSIIFENNKPMVNAAQLLGAKRYKTYRFFEKEI